jgi:hypothetical protein
MEFLFQLLAIFWVNCTLYAIDALKLLLQFKFVLLLTILSKLLLTSSCLQHTNICFLATRLILSDDPLRPANPHHLAHLKDN